MNHKAGVISLKIICPYLIVSVASSWSLFVHIWYYLWLVVNPYSLHSWPFLWISLPHSPYFFLQSFFPHRTLNSTLDWTHIHLSEKQNETKHCYCYLPGSVFQHIRYKPTRTNTESVITIRTITTGKIIPKKYQRHSQLDWILNFTINSLLTEQKHTCFLSSLDSILLNIFQLCKEDFIW